MNRKSFVLILIIIIITTYGCTNYSIENTELNNTTELNNPTIITREQFIEQYALTNNISYLEADILITEQTENSLLYLPDEEKTPGYEENLNWIYYMWNQKYYPNPHFSTNIVLVYLVLVQVGVILQ